MKRLCIASFAALLITTTSFAQNNEGKDLHTAINEMVELLARDLKLDDWQCFMMDSTLMYNYTKLNEEVSELRRGGVYNSEIYMMTSDKWTAATDTTFEKKVLTPEQWQKYLKTDCGREKRARDKRQALRDAKQVSDPKKGSR